LWAAAAVAKAPRWHPVNDVAVLPALGILDNGWTTWLVGPTPVTLTPSWQRFKVSGTMTGGATALWIGVACGPMLVVGKDTTESPFKVRGPGSNLADHTLLEVTAGGELIIASGAGNGYRLAEIVGIILQH
jgi:hypothetical protein